MKVAEGVWWWMKLNEERWSLRKVYNSGWWWMKVYEGVRRRMRVDDGGWRWMTVDDSPGQGFPAYRRLGAIPVFNAMWRCGLCLQEFSSIGLNTVLERYERNRDFLHFAPQNRLQNSEIVTVSPSFPEFICALSKPSHQYSRQSLMTGWKT